jgi:hypothetical protein
MQWKPIYQTHILDIRNSPNFYRENANLYSYNRFSLSHTALTMEKFSHDSYKIIKQHSSYYVIYEAVSWERSMKVPSLHVCLFSFFLFLHILKVKFNINQKMSQSPLSKDSMEFSHLNFDNLSNFHENFGALFNFRQNFNNKQDYWNYGCRNFILSF